MQADGFTFTVHLEGALEKEMYIDYIMEIKLSPKCLASFSVLYEKKVIRLNGNDLRGILVM